jgi:hypothetical protein
MACWLNCIKANTLLMYQCNKEQTTFRYRCIWHSTIKQKEASQSWISFSTGKKNPTGGGTGGCHSGRKYKNPFYTFTLRPAVLREKPKGHNCMLVPRGTDYSSHILLDASFKHSTPLQSVDQSMQGTKTGHMWSKRQASETAYSAQIWQTQKDGVGLRLVTHSSSVPKAARWNRSTTRIDT